MCGGGGNPLDKVFGGGDAWKKDHAKILAHARGLKYDKVPGVTLPSANAPKEVWIAAMNKFNAWKAGEVKKEASGNAWWQTYGKVKGGSGKSKGKPTSETKPPADKKPPSGSRPGMGPYPEENVFFPMLNQPYTAPRAMNLSAYMPADPYGGGMLMGGAPARYDQAVFPGVYDAKGNLDMTRDVGRPDYSKMKGLLYQPFTTQYQQAFVAPSIWNYQPPQLRVGPVQYMANPYAMSPEALAAMVEAAEKEEKKKGGKKKPPTAIVPEESHLPHGSQGGVPDAPGDNADRPGHDPSMGGAGTAAGKGSFGGMSEGLAGPR